MLFLAVITLYTVCYHGDATSCTALTGWTCTKTNFVTGECSNDVCACANGYEPARSGCVEKLTLIVEIVASLVGNPELTAKGSGEVIIGGSVTVRCTVSGTAPLGATFVWTKDSTEISGQTTNTLTLSKVTTSDSGQYRCRARLDSSDYVSQVSDFVTIRVIPDGGTFQGQPAVTGMFKRSMMNAPITLECTNIPSGLSLAFEWHMAGENMNTKTKLFTFTMTNRTLAKSVTCGIVNLTSTADGSSPAAKFVVASSQSSAVTTPASLTSDITGVYIQEADGGSAISTETGGGFIWHCKIVDDDLALATGGVTFSWTKNNASTGSGETLNRNSPDATGEGTYTCLGKVGDNSPRESNGLELKVKSPGAIIGTVTVVSQPSSNRPLLGGYFVIHCLAQVANFSNTIYTWYKDNNIIHGQRDRYIQINTVRVSDSGNYSCSAATGLTTKQSNVVTIPAPASMNSVVPNAPTTDKPAGDAFGVGNTYTLTCSHNYETPGLTYKWMEGNQLISGAASKSYTLTAKSGTNSYSCQIAFNGMESQISPVTNITTSNIVRVAVELTGAPVTGTTIRPLNTDNVTLECTLTKSAGSSGSETYQWLKDDRVVQGQTSSKYTFVANASSNGQIKCRVTLGSESLDTSPVTVSSVATLVAPMLSVVNTDVRVSGQQVYSEGASYTILCVTASHTDNARYTWFKSGAIINNSSRLYTISGAKKGQDGDSGVYSCQVAVGASSVNSTTNVTIAIGEPGRPCNYATDCVGSQYGTACALNRCECADGYTLNGNVCSGISRLVGSVLLLTLCAVIYRLAWPSLTLM